MKAKLIKNDIGYHLWLNPETKEQEHIASDNPVIDNWGVDLRKYKLSKQNCDEIFGVVDVEKLAASVSQDTISSPYYAYIGGFNKAMELNKDKVFTLEDMRTAYSDGASNIDCDGDPIDNPDDDFIDTIERIKSKTEIDVMIVMEDSIGISDKYTPDNNPKLDSQGNLILKKL
jgi:hypothetical protein